MTSALNQWENFSQIMLRGLSEETAYAAQSLYRELLDHASEDESWIRTREGLYVQTAALDLRQVQALMQEVVRFVQKTRPTHLKSGQQALADFFKQVQETYSVIDQSFFVPLSLYEERINSAWAKLPAYKAARAQDVRLTGELYDTFNKDLPKVRKRYEVLARVTKTALPAHFHSLIDTVVQMFVYEGYETGLLYIRRSMPGTIGAFHGLPEKKR